MTNDSSTPWVLQYRASVSDTSTPALDQAVLAAAGRQLARRRTARQMKGASLIAAFGLISVSLLTVHQAGFDLRRADYGRFEGISRRYLMEVQRPQFTGFGSTERSP